MAARSRSRRHAYIALAVLCALLLGACGGKSKSESQPPTSAPSSDTSHSISTETTVAKAECTTAPGKQKGRIRFVNVYTNPKYPKRDIDVWQGLSATDPCAKKLTTVPFGKASDYIDITASDASGNWSAAAYIAGSTDKNHEIVVQGETWLGNEQVTMAFEGAAPQTGAPASAGIAQTFLEKNNIGEPALFVPAAGKAALGITSALQTVAKDGAWLAAVTGRPGCLQALSDTTSRRSSVAGTRLVRYSVDPGSLELALHRISGSCSGPPDIGPVTIDARPGSSTFVFAYGANAKHLALLVLPIAQ